MQQPVQRQVTRPNQSIPKSDTSSEMSNDVIRRLGNMSVSVPNNPKPEDQPKAMTKDERIEIVKGMILEEPNGINLKNLYHKFISKFPEKQNSSNYTYLTSFESFVHQQRQALSCEIDDEGIVSPIAFSAEHFMEIFDKASSDERALNKELTGNILNYRLFIKYYSQSGGWWRCCSNKKSVGITTDSQQYINYSKITISPLPSMSLKMILTGTITGSSQ